MKTKSKNAILLNSKKFVLGFFALLLCAVVMLSGCAGQRVLSFETTETELEVLDFYNYVHRQKTNFFNFIEQDCLDNEEFETGLTSSEESVYNFSTLLIQNLSNKFYMLVPVLDFYLNDIPAITNETGFYNLTDLNIEDYRLFEKTASGDAKSYYKKLSGDHVNEYLPETIISGDTNNNEDFIDNTISTWGNALTFDVTYNTANSTYSILAKTEFYYPSANDVMEQDENGIKIKRYNALNKIAIVYSEGVTVYSKVVEYTNNQKIIKKYSGDYITGSAHQIGQYEYVFASSLPNSNGTVVGSYEFRFDETTGYLTAKYTQSAGNYYVFECYLLSGDMIIMRINKVSVGERINAFDLFIESGVRGKLKKYEVQNNMVRIEDLTKIIASEFGVITNADKQITTYKKIAFVIDETGFVCESVGY